MMKATKRAALKLMMQRYTTVRNVSRETARASLIDEGIYTKDGKIAVEYGGVREKKTASNLK